MFSESAKRVAREPTTPSDLKFALPLGERTPFRVFLPPQEGIMLE
jgi:hypothetical protein